MASSLVLILSPPIPTMTSWMTSPFRDVPGHPCPSSFPSATSVANVALCQFSASRVVKGRDSSCVSRLSHIGPGPRPPALWGAWIHRPWLLHASRCLTFIVLQHTSNLLRCLLCLSVFPGFLTLRRTSVFQFHGAFPPRSGSSFSFHESDGLFGFE